MPPVLNEGEQGNRTGPFKKVAAPDASSRNHNACFGRARRGPASAPDLLERDVQQRRTVGNNQYLAAGKPL